MGHLRIPGQRMPLVLPCRAAAAALAMAAVCLQPTLNLPAQAAAANRTTRPAAPRAHAASLTPWELAERARDSFEASPDYARTRADYARVMDHFRAIYHDNPRDLHAPEAINAVAELLAEEGSGLHDPRCFQAAVGQYEFLRTQYPGSSLRVGALLAQGQIEENDLHDSATAKKRYQLLLTTYPYSALAEQARAGIAAIAGAGRPRSEVARNPPAIPSPDGSSRSLATVATPPPGSGQVAQPLREPAAPIVRAKPSNEPRLSSEPRLLSETRPSSEARPSTEAERLNASAARELGTDTALPPPRQVAHRSGPLASVSGIRHWSTSTYTRVAIDLGSEVEYEAARVPSPDRIFFDLHGARLAPDLAGKSFAVTDEGFLKRIRAAQTGDVTRVVLDVNDVTEYSAFLLPNPYRLIIDIHGKPKTAQQLAASQFASVDAPAPHTATVPNTRAVRAGNPADVSSLSDQPGKVEATSTPTSQPIAATVAGRDRSGELTSPYATRLAPTLPASQPANPRTTPLSSGSDPERPGVNAARRGEGPASSSPGPAALTPADTRIVGDPNPAATARTVAAAKRSGRKGSKAAAAADARIAGVPDPATPARAAAIHTADGQTSLVRALGLKINRIVIDAGHGGHDSGTLGVGGIQEKDVVLDVALRLGALLHDRLGAEVIYTRSDDTFIPLETRTAIANKAQADLFLSIHANSSPDASARGVETYYLNFTQQADALEVAARENAVSGQSVSQLSDLVRKITLKDKLAESREFATDVETSLYSGLDRPLPAAASHAIARSGTRSAAASPSGGSALASSFTTGTNLPAGPAFKDRGVKKAPFVVLIGANMPSVLAEISFLTNARDAGLLLQPDYKQRVAESLFRGIARYVGSLSSATPGTPIERAAATSRIDPVQ